MRKHVIVGTAGHIDHGKTALVKALTGVDADRLKEEKERGITIDLGFAHLDLGAELRLGFIDVPGHERFVKNMLAGAGGIDLVVLVIAADESAMPQTREHFEICRLLNLRAGMVALTKCDLVESDLVELVKLETEDLVAGSFLEGAPIVSVSARTGEGVEELRETLRDLAGKVEARNAGRHFRLPIDRVFVMKGFGAVVTGTIVSGALTPETEVEIQPGGRRARVRGVQAHGELVERAVAGQRAAVNLAGVDAADVTRGMTLTAAGLLQPTSQFDCRVELLASAPALKHGAPVHFHAGSAEVEAQVFHLDRRPKLAPGDSCYSQIRLAEPLLLLPQDRFILRRFSPVMTIGGGAVILIDAPRRRAKGKWQALLDAMASGDPPRMLDAVVGEREWGIALPALMAATGWTETEIREESAGLIRVSESPLWLAHPGQVAAASERAQKWLQRFHEQNPLLPGASPEALRTSEFPGAPVAWFDFLLDRLNRDGTIATDEELVRLAGRKIVLQAEEQESRDRLIKAFREAGLQVPALKEFLPTLPVDAERSRRLLQSLLREKVLVRISPELVFHSEAISALLESLRGNKQAGESIRVPEFKELAGVSRKYAIPLLEYLDRTKVTRRSGANRILL